VATSLTQKKAACSRKADISLPSQSLPFEKVQHRVDTTDAQPSNESGGIVVIVTGALMVSCNDLPISATQGRSRAVSMTAADDKVFSQVDDQPQPMNYTQIFQLLPESGTYFVQNDIFRLVYPAC
jgi:hypothetical protein